MSNWKQYLLGKWNWKRPFYSLISVYTLLLIFVIFFAEKLIFFPPTAPYSEELHGFHYIINDQDEQIATIYKKATAGMPTILWSHGNAEDISTAQSYMEYLHEQGYGYLAYDYPGYGLSAGKPTEKGCYQNIQASWNYLTETLAIPENQIFIIGQSVGTGPSVWLAEKTSPAGLVLISPFKSINRVPFGINPFPYDRFPSIKNISNVKAPLLVIHGDQDQVIKQAHGEAIYEKHRGTKLFYNATNLGHNDILSNTEVTNTLFAFLK